MVSIEGPTATLLLPVVKAPNGLGPAATLKLPSLKTPGAQVSAANAETLLNACPLAHGPPETFSDGLG
jgi:hypothetical protein